MERVRHMIMEEQAIRPVRLFFILINCGCPTMPFRGNSSLPHPNRVIWHSTPISLPKGRKICAPTFCAFSSLCVYPGCGAWLPRGRFAWWWGLYCCQCGILAARHPIAVRRWDNGGCFGKDRHCCTEICVCGGRCWCGDSFVWEDRCWCCNEGGRCVMSCGGGEG